MLVTCHCGARVNVTLSGNRFAFNASGESYVRSCSRLKEALQASGKLEEAFACPDLLRAIQAKRAR